MLMTGARILGGQKYELLANLDASEPPRLATDLPRGYLRSHEPNRVVEELTN